MSEFICVRRAVAADARAIEDVRFAGWRHTYRSVVPEVHFTRWDREAKAREQQRTAFGAGHGVFVGESEERVVGFVTAETCRDADADGWGEIGAIYLLPEWIGRGVGRLLLDTALQQLSDHGRVVVWMLRDNPLAGPFYARSGFLPDGGRRNVVLGGVLLPEIRLSRWSTPP